ncbi:hypothetical protein A5819_000005 [Enterococcus sp. 7E2_DIV0204]|uniref:hypothetical protein n=1 Tax=unclassified Enterococcus TaxID=2608891 RepID=UPI000A339CB2|nr:MULTISPECIES: hypothetical protein [unclassified Enterococcus]OTN87559.1 hypothetical protein A5819_000005 [Enterococcus sp. 7E2_DIV0204]OTP49755.1 hypothetical protein A5884_002955 [Enterococcus sp. 7D2_DIV0200]
MNYIFFYKNEVGESIPVSYGSCEDYSFLNVAKKHLEQTYKKHPQSENNLFVLVNDHEFKID